MQDIITLANLKLKDGGSNMVLQTTNINEGRQLLDQQREAILRDALVLQEVAWWLGQREGGVDGRRKT
jgi:hypothetical protein